VLLKKVSVEWRKSFFCKTEGLRRFIGDERITFGRFKPAVSKNVGKGGQNRIAHPVKKGLGKNIVSQNGLCGTLQSTYQRQFSRIDSGTCIGRGKLEQQAVDIVINYKQAAITDGIS